MRFYIRLTGLWIVLQLLLPVTLPAVDVAPRISDREITEKLARLEAGQKALSEKVSDLRTDMRSGQDALRAEMKSGQDALRAEMKSGQQALSERVSDLRAEMKSGLEALHKRQDDSNNTMLFIFGSLISLIVALFGYIAWDRRTMVRPVMDQVNRLELQISKDLDFDHSDGSLVKRQLQALQQYAGKNPEFAEIMRGLALL
ncbi:MAG: hypothetical protein R6U68_00330 [Desulfobacteraceae bacterium]